MLSASEPCGEAVNEDDVESGSPFLYALTNQLLTTPDRAIRDKGYMDTWSILN